MTAWDNLIAGSTLTSGTAWDHLNAQGGGASGDVYVVNAGSAELSDTELSGRVLSAAMSVDIVGEISATLAQSILEGNIHV